MPGASYDMFVSGIYNPQMNSTQDVMTYNEVGENSTSLYIIRNPLARWNEECTVLDSHSMHHAILLVKPKIIEALDKYKNEELTEKRDKKAKEDDKIKRMKEMSDATSTEYKNTVENSPTIADASDLRANNITITESSTDPTEPAANVTIEEHVGPSVTFQQQDDNNTHDTLTNVEMSEVRNEDTSQAAETTPAERTTTETAVDPVPQIEEIAVSQEEATQFLVNFLSGTCNIFTIINADEKRIAVEALRISDSQRAAQELAAINVQNYPQNFVFLDGEYFL
jgi:hypothetical protein